MFLVFTEEKVNFLFILYVLGKNTYVKTRFIINFFPSHLASISYGSAYLAGIILGAKLGANQVCT